MLRDIDHSLPAAQRTLFRVLAREAGKVGTLFLIILYVNCYCGMVDYSLASGHGAVHWRGRPDRKSTRLNSSHTVISYAVFCLKKKKMTEVRRQLLPLLLGHLSQLVSEILHVAARLLRIPVRVAVTPGRQLAQRTRQIRALGGA